MKFLKTHGRFLIVLVVLLVLLYLAAGELSESRKLLESSRTKARTLLTQNYNQLFKDAKQFSGDPATVQGRRIQDATQVIQQVESQRNAMLAFETDPAFTLAAMPPGAGDDGDKITFYRAKVLQLQRELAYRRYFVPDAYAKGAFGFDETRVTAPEVPELLRRLDIVRTVVGSAGRTGVARVNRLAFREVAGELAARGLPVNPVAEGEPPYLRGQGLEIEVQASEEALYNLLVDLQRPMKDASRTRYLSVERFKFEKPDLLNPADDLIKGTLTVVAWQVNEASSYPVDKSAPEQQQTGIRGPRSFR